MGVRQMAHIRLNIRACKVDRGFITVQYSNVEEVWNRSKHIEVKNIAELEVQRALFINEIKEELKNAQTDKYTGTSILHHHLTQGRKPRGFDVFCRQTENKVITLV